MDASSLFINLLCGIVTAAIGGVIVLQYEYGYLKRKEMGPTSLVQEQGLTFDKHDFNVAETFSPYRPFKYLAIFLTGAGFGLIPYLCITLAALNSYSSPVALISGLAIPPAMIGGALAAFSIDNFFEMQRTMLLLRLTLAAVVGLIGGLFGILVLCIGLIWLLWPFIIKLFDAALKASMETYGDNNKENKDNEDK